MSEYDYRCLDCGWDPPMDSFYYVEEGEYFDCTVPTATGIGGDPEIEHEVYPKYKDFQHNYGKAMEFGGSPIDWTEVHFCPSCGKEFEFENSNC